MNQHISHCKKIKDSGLLRCITYNTYMNSTTVLGQFGRDNVKGFAQQILSCYHTMQSTHTQDVAAGTNYKITPERYHIYRHAAICNSECHKC